MIPQRFAESNIVMLAPKGMENCCDVHAHKGPHQIITCWKPTPEEMVKINLGEPVWLCIWTDGSMPPVWVGADYPFIKQENAV